MVHVAVLVSVVHITLFDIVDKFLVVALLFSQLLGVSHFQKLIRVSCDRVNLLWINVDVKVYFVHKFLPFVF